MYLEIGGIPLKNGRRNTLLQRWIRLFPDASLSRTMQVFYELWEAYNEPFREYHDITHIEWLLKSLDEHFPHAPLEVELALWFHDVVCAPGSSTNELMSSQFAEEKLIFLGCEPQFILRVCNAIEDTRDHLPHSEISVIVCDLDLLSLSLPRDEYVVNTHRIGREYLVVCSEEQWRSGRLLFLEAFLARPQIYFSTIMYEWRESAARRNLELDRELLTAQ